MNIHLPIRGMIIAMLLIGGAHAQHGNWRTFSYVVGLLFAVIALIEFSVWLTAWLREFER